MCHRISVGQKLNLLKKTRSKLKGSPESTYPFLFFLYFFGSHLFGKIFLLLNTQQYWVLLAKVVLLYQAWWPAVFFPNSSYHLKGNKKPTEKHRKWFMGDFYSLLSETSANAAQFSPPMDLHMCLCRQAQGGCQPLPDTLQRWQELWPAPCHETAVPLSPPKHPPENLAEASGR